MPTPTLTLSYGDDGEYAVEMYDRVEVRVDWLSTRLDHYVRRAFGRPDIEVMP